jgi:hypothetical protein
VPVPYPMEAFLLFKFVVKFENMNVPKSILFDGRQGRYFLMMCITGGLIRAKCLNVNMHDYPCNFI